MKKRPKLLWLIQSNQITPSICSFLKVLQTRMEHLLDLTFIIPETSKEIEDKLKAVNPAIAHLTTRTAISSPAAYRAKKEILGHEGFSEGLTYSDVLLIDDFGAGNVIQTTIDLSDHEASCGIIIQIPTPLGSSETEERVFHAAILWAQQQRIPIIGYELLPLDTRWMIAPSLVDGVITRTKESYDHLRGLLPPERVWLLPAYEGSLFSSMATEFNLNGVKSAYHNRSQLKIPEHRPVIYLPHNVAMTHEYGQLLDLMLPLAKDLHLMFSEGKDQARGAYTHQKTIELVYRRQLSHFASYSFHDLNATWEMMLADVAVACSPCFQTMIAQDKSIPSLIYDPFLPPAEIGFKTRVNSRDGLLAALDEMIQAKACKTEFGTLFMQLAGSPTP